MISFGKFNLSDYSDCIVVTDENVAKLYGIAGDNVFVLPAGEDAKSLSYIEALCNFFFSHGLSRQGKVVAVGGGCVGDSVGFAASIYKRGVNLLHVPTTLVAQVDSSIGGKTAIDLCGVKNLCGTFYNADTLIDFTFLSTLSRQEILGGMGEIIKYRMICPQVDAASRQGIIPTIRECIAYKTVVCNSDPHDLGARHVLNAGHTIGHGIEMAYNLPHGYAVANGLYHELELALECGLATPQYVAKWQKEISSHYTIYAVTPQVLQLARHDKKNDGAQISFALPTQDGVKTLSLYYEELIKIYA